jgi:hypothetical protein
VRESREKETKKQKIYTEKKKERKAKEQHIEENRLQKKNNPEISQNKASIFIVFLIPSSRKLLRKPKRKKAYKWTQKEDKGKQ